MRVLAVVVTYNRQTLLQQCLAALFEQTLPCHILVVDNASSDGTDQWLAGQSFYADSRFHYLRTETNLGGAGGFSRGLQYALRIGGEWLWLMDDDAQPHTDALAHMMAHATNTGNLYGSVPVGWAHGKRKLCFPAPVITGKVRRMVEYQEALQDLEAVAWLPFLGFMIHAQLVQQIGFPDERFFILDDDVEYSERAKQQGARIFMVKHSLLDHPLAPTLSIRLPGRSLYYRAMPPWKTYFDVRNKILIAKRYYGKRLWTQTLPGILLRLVCGLCREKQSGAIMRAYVLAMWDGLRNRSSRRFLA